MIHLLVLAVAALHLQDPAGDAVGDGTLAPPTAPVYANTADFDLQAVTLTSDAKLTVRVQLGAVSDPAGLPNGFSNPILEVYLDTKPGGAQQLLPGSSMAMPPKHGWEIALRATGDEAYAVEAQSQGSPASWPRLPVTVDVKGNTITLQTQIPRPGRADLYALTGVYDPFTADGWRPLTTSVSPWAFSSATQQVPVVDLLASSQSAQRREIDSGVLSPFRSPLYGLWWLLLMVLGLITAAAGLVLRRRARAPERPSAAREATPPTEAADPAAPPAGVGRASESHLDETGTPSAIHERFLDEEEEAALWPDAEASVDRAVAGAAGAALADRTGHGTEGPASDVVAEAAEERAADGDVVWGAPDGPTPHGPTPGEQAGGEDGPDMAPDERADTAPRRARPAEPKARVRHGDAPAKGTTAAPAAGGAGAATVPGDATATGDATVTDDATVADDGTVADDASVSEGLDAENGTDEDAADEDEAGTDAGPGQRRP